MIYRYCNMYIQYANYTYRFTLHDLSYSTKRTISRNL